MVFRLAFIGAFVWGIMRFIIFPYISHLDPKPIVGKEKIINAAICAGIIVICIGLPVVLLAKKYFKGKI